MSNQSKASWESFLIKEFFLLIGFAAIMTNFLLSLTPQFALLENIFSNDLSSFTAVFCVTVLLFLITLVLTICFKTSVQSSRMYALVTLSPVILLPLVNTDKGIIIPLLIILGMQMLFYVILSHQAVFQKDSTILSKLLVASFALIYFVWACFINIEKFNHFTFFNPVDFAIYNQTFFNTINGRFFLNSTYGSNFTSHNTWFYLLLVPFYALFAHPLTLMVLKSFFLSLSVIPFYLIIKDTVKPLARVPIILMFLVNPYLISQNFNPPHEICYVPFFLLFAFYFFKKQRFLPFMIFLCICLSIKEHLAMIAVMFGIYALFEQKKRKWILIPVLLGILWGLFSIGILHHFNQIYSSGPKSSWLITDLINRFFLSESNLFDSLRHGIQTSNIRHGILFRSAVIDLLSPVGFILPFLSTISLLSLPELILNLLSDRIALLGPTRHYNIIVVCFFLIAMVEGLKKISLMPFVKNLKMDRNILILLLSLVLLSSNILRYDSWIHLTTFTKDQERSQTLRKAIHAVPQEASVSVPKYLAVHVSSRRHYALLKDKKYLDYVIFDKTILSDDSPLFFKNYVPIFDQNNIMVIKKSFSQSL